MVPIIVAIIICLVVAGLIYALVIGSKIKKNGIEVEAKVSRVDIETSQVMNNDTNTMETETTKHFFVEYKNESGEIVEASLMNPKFTQKEGDIIKIKYLPEKPKNVLRVK